MKGTKTNYCSGDFHKINTEYENNISDFNLINCHI
jgi:hypothetical protein